MFSQFISIIIFVALFISSAALAISNTEGIQTYQKNSALIPEHKQKLADDLTRYRNADNLWDALREEFSLMHYEDQAAVQEKIEWFMNNQDFLLRSASRAAPYLYYISEQVKQRHLPAELVLLPIIESGYNPFALSNVGAAGIWQMMPDTASGLGIRRDAWYDGRRDVIASTRAALNYLAYLQSFFEGNWLLAIAAYNTGEGNVLSAIKRNIREGRDTEFWDLPVAQQTKDYVPSLLALAVIISHPEQYPVYLPPVRNAPYLAQVDIGTQINLKYAAGLAGMSHKKLLQLNPGFNHALTSLKGPYKLVLPIENVEQFTENFSRAPISKPIDWMHYHVKTGDTLASVSKKFSADLLAIKKLNKIKTNLHPGTDILIPFNAQMAALSEQEHSERIKTKTWVAERKPNKPAKDAPILSHYTLQAGDTIYMVRNKDSIQSIAKHFHINPMALIAANGLKGKSLAPGHQLVIPTHLASNTNVKTNSRLSANRNIAPGDTLYMVRRGDTIEKIARRFHTSAAAIRLTNLVDDQTLSVGEQILIPARFNA